jgi:hypothetical protein
VYQIIGNLTKAPRSKLISKLKFSEDHPAVRYVRCFITFILVCLAWIAFRANSLGDMIALYKTVFTGWGGIDLSASLDAMGLSAVGILSSVLSIYVMKLLDTEINLKPDEDRSGEPLHPHRAGAYVLIAWCVCIAWMILLASDTASSFIYFQF